MPTLGHIVRFAVLSLECPGLINGATYSVTCTRGSHTRSTASHICDAGFVKFTDFNESQAVVHFKPGDRPGTFQPKLIRFQVEEASRHRRVVGEVHVDIARLVTPGTGMCRVNHRQDFRMGGVGACIEVSVVIFPEGGAPPPPIAPAMRSPTIPALPTQTFIMPSPANGNGGLPPAAPSAGASPSAGDDAGARIDRDTAMSILVAFEGFVASQRAQAAQQERAVAQLDRVGVLEARIREQEQRNASLRAAIAAAGDSAARRAASEVVNLSLVEVADAHFRLHWLRDRDEQRRLVCAEIGLTEPEALQNVDGDLVVKRKRLRAVGSQIDGLKATLLKLTNEQELLGRLQAKRDVTADLCQNLEKIGSVEAQLAPLAEEANALSAQIAAGEARGEARHRALERAMVLVEKERGEADVQQTQLDERLPLAAAALLRQKSVAVKSIDDLFSDAFGSAAPAAPSTLQQPQTAARVTATASTFPFSFEQQQQPQEPQLGLQRGDSWFAKNFSPEGSFNNRVVSAPTVPDLFGATAPTQVLAPHHVPDPAMVPVWSPESAKPTINNFAVAQQASHVAQAHVVDLFAATSTAAPDLFASIGGAQAASAAAIQQQQRRSSLTPSVPMIPAVAPPSFQQQQQQQQQPQVLQSFSGSYEPASAPQSASLSPQHGTVKTLPALEGIAWPAQPSSQPLHQTSEPQTATANDNHLVRDAVEAERRRVAELHEETARQLALLEKLRAERAAEEERIARLRSEAAAVEAQQQQQQRSRSVSPAPQVPSMGVVDASHMQPVRELRQRYQDPMQVAQHDLFAAPPPRAASAPSSENLFDSWTAPQQPASLDPFGDSRITSAGASERAAAAEKAAADKAEVERIAAAADKAAAEKAAADKAAAEKAATDKAAAEKAASERAAAEKAAAEKAATDKAAAEKAAAEKAAAEKAAADKAAAEKTAAEKAAAEKAAAEKVAAEKAEAERIAAEKAAAEKAEAERIAAEKAEAERIAAAEKAEAERIAAAERAAAEKAAERAAAEKAAAEKAAADKAAADKAAAERAAADKAAAENAADAPKDVFEQLEARAPTNGGGDLFANWDPFGNTPAANTPRFEPPPPEPLAAPTNDGGDLFSSWDPFAAKASTSSAPTTSAAAVDFASFDPFGQQGGNVAFRRQDSGFGTTFEGFKPIQTQHRAEDVAQGGGNGSAGTVGNVPISPQPVRAVVPNPTESASAIARRRMMQSIKIDSSDSD